MPSLFFGQWLLGKIEKWLNWKISGSLDMCCTQLAQVGNADFYEVEFAIFFPSVLVTLVESRIPDLSLTT